MPYEQRFAALMNPLRQQMLDELARSPKSVGQLTDALGVSQPVASQHLKALKDAGILRVQAIGTRRMYHVRPDALEELRAMIETRWTSVFAAMSEDVRDDN